MTFDDVDLKAGWLDYPRGKTGAERRAKLWPETTEAIAEAIAMRKKPKDKALAKTIFITRIGKSWYKEDSTTNPISQAFRKLLKDSGNHTKGVGFYALRRSFATVAAQTMDQPAINLCLGHVDNSMQALYRQRIDDMRLENLAAHVRTWLFDDTGENSSP